MSLLQRTLVVSKKLQMRQLAKTVSEQVFVADDVLEAMDLVGRVRPDMVVFDDQSSPEQVRSFLDADDSAAGSVPVVVVGGSDRFDTRVEVLANDAEVDRLERIALGLTRRSEPAALETGWQRFFTDELAASVPMVGVSPAVRDELRLIKLVAASQCNPVLIIGETGTGKEIAARAIHRLRHPDEPFVAVNCAALTANLLESELFGHVKGSFTGADREKTGLFELAGSGTIFLDEISEMPLDLQAKLLRALQERTFRKVGGVKDVVCRATIIASSNRNPKAEVKANRFRQDLYYRLSVCPIVLSPLRQARRRDDILVLADYFIRHSTICPDKQGRIRSLTKLAAEALHKHDWPGNVRELKNVMDRAILLENTDKIGLSSIVIDPEEYEHSQDQDLTAGLKDFSLAKAERELIARALKETGWQKSQAASLLGITRATLYAKVKQYNIEKDTESATTYKKADLDPIIESVPVEV